MILQVRSELADLDPQLQNNNYILALDQATSECGWALFKDENLVDYGVLKSVGYEAEKIEHVRNWLENKIKQINSNNLIILLEDIQQQGTAVNTFKVLAHLQGVLINHCFRNKISFEIYYSSSWKSTLNIKGKARAEQKKNAQLLIKELYGKTIAQDACDAICIGLHHIKQKKTVINFE